MKKDLFKDIEKHILTWDEINEHFDVSESDIQKTIERQNYMDNYWYPSEDFIHEDDIPHLVKAFRGYIYDTDIKDKFGPKKTEIFLNTMEKHQLKYSIIRLYELECDKITGPCIGKYEE